MRIIYIDIDTLRPDHLGCYGYHRPTSPVIDEVAASGARFTGCYASDVPCLPSRTALFSGRFGIKTGVVTHAGVGAKMRYPGDGHGTDPRRKPLPMVLSQGGVRATTFSTFHQRHLAWPFCAGWDEIQRFTQSIGDEIATELEGPAVRWLEAHAEEEDWFLHLHFWDPHIPYNTPAEYGNPFEDYDAPAFPSAEVIDEQLQSYGPTGAADITAMLRGGPRKPDALAGREDFRTWIDGYDVGIRFADETIGRILNVLADQGVLDDTAVIISTDHGENQGELNQYGSHISADAITCRLPLIIRWPGLASGTVHPDLLYQLDLAPTLCDLLDLDAPEDWDGRSFAPVLRGEQYERRPYLVLGQGVWFVQRAVVSDGHIYIRTLHKALNPMADELLFDLANDPHEEVNLIDREPARAAAMARLMGDWWHEHAADAGADPLLQVCREGGSLYVRGAVGVYTKHLRDTGRDWAAEEIEQRRIFPVVDRFDLSRF